MAKVLRTTDANLDLVEIASYIADDNPDAAFRLLDTIDAKLHLIAESPLIGKSRDEIAPRLRSFTVGNYILFYRPVEHGIELIRVLHGARDLRRAFRSRKP